MIINTGSRTDTVQYYSNWLLKRFEEGFVYSKNPMFQMIAVQGLSFHSVLVFCVKLYKYFINIYYYDVSIIKFTDYFE